MGRVLVIDNEPDLVTVLCDVLNEKDYQASGFTSGLAALKVLREQDFDLLLTDLMMPDMNGIDILREALALDPDLVGIMIAGRGTVPMAVEAMKAGAYDFIRKPFTFGTLLNVMVRAAEMRRLRNENLQLRESMAVYEVAMAVSSTLQTDAILDGMASALLDHCEADEMSVMLLTEAGDELCTAAARGGPCREAVGERIPFGQGIAGWVVRHRQPLMLQGEIQNARFVPRNPRPEIKASVSLPLLAGGQCIGVLTVNSKRRRSFLMGKLNGLKLLAGVAATALANARLYRGLRESEERYRRMVETATEGVWVLDHSGRTSFVNQKMAEMLACDPQELLGRSLSEFLDPRESGEVGNRAGNRNEVKFRRRDGRELWAIVSTNPCFEPNGRNSSVLTMVTDITERKRLEKEMTRLERLHLVGEMAAGIGHEIRNPITTLRGFLQHPGTKPGCACYAEHFELMIQELDRANVIITEYLSLARSKVVDLTVRDLNSVVEAMFPLLHSYALLADKGLRLEAGAVSPFGVDEKEIRQLVLNLVRNGLEAMGPGGNLTIRTFPDGGDVVLAVRDEGNGIDAGVMEKLGTPFVTTKDINVTGLGLAVCYSIAARHNAVIEVDTGPAGTTFYVRFRNKAPGEDPGPGHPPDPPKRCGL